MNALQIGLMKDTKMDEHTKEYTKGYEQGVKDLADRILKYYKNLKDQTYSGIVTFTVEVAMNELFDEE